MLAIRCCEECLVCPAAWVNATCGLGALFRPGSGRGFARNTPANGAFRRGRAAKSTIWRPDGINTQSSTRPRIMGAHARGTPSPKNTHLDPLPDPAQDRPLDYLYTTPWVLREFLVFPPSGGSNQQMSLQVGRFGGPSRTVSRTSETIVLLWVSS